jgi:hypothetical protein
VLVTSDQEGFEGDGSKGGNTSANPIAPDTASTNSNQGSGNSFGNPELPKPLVNPLDGTTPENKGIPEMTGGDSPKAGGKNDPADNPGSSEEINKPKNSGVNKNLMVVEADNANRIIIAEGKDVLIKGSNAVIVISGGCGILTVNGNRNQVQCDSSTGVKVNGDGNTLVMGTLGNGSISGDNNVLSWGTGVGGADPIVQASGSQNRMKRLE